MATFPALIPASRTFTAATYPGAVQLAYSGRESRVRTSNAQTGARFRLAFSALSESEMLAIRDHYWGQRGRFVPFQLSTELLSGMANPSAVTPTGYQWIYVNSPRVTDIPAGTAEARSCRHDVELELELVPEVSALVSGANWVAMAAMAGGAADDGEIRLPGATWLATAAIDGGTPAVSISVAGADWSAAAAMAGGAANGDNADVLGATWTAAASIAGGVANDGTGDANFSGVSLLLHMDGSNGSTTFTDSSGNPKTVTAYGNAQITTTGAQYGSGCGLFDGAGDYLTVASTDELQFGTSNLTWEMWIKTTSTTRYATLYSRTPANNANALGLWVLGINYASSSAGDVWLFIRDVGTSPLLISTGASVNDGAYHHIAITNNAGAWNVWIDGQSRGSASYIYGIYVVSNSFSTNYIGRDPTNVYGSDYDGRIDDFRVTKGLARYNGTFTPPTTAFPNS